MNWEVSLVWDEPARIVIATDVPLTEARDIASSAMLRTQSPGWGGRRPALMVSRMDAVTYRSDRVAARKGKRKHPVERAWQETLRGVNAERKKAEIERKRAAKSKGGLLEFANHDCSVRSFTCQH